MSTPVTVTLAISDRQSSRDFYRAFLGLEPPGEPAEDGIPEPLRFQLNDGFCLMLIPSGGFGWVVEDAGTVAEVGTINALVSLDVSTEAEVDDIIERVHAAGGTVMRTAQHEEWGYSCLVADPDGHVWQVNAPLDESEPPL
jgi:uncharacterized protein